MSWIKQVSLHGLRAYLTKDDILVGRSAVATGGVGKPGIMIPGSSDYVAVFDDFLARPNVGINDTGVGVVGRVNHHEGTFFRWIGTDTGNDTKLLDTGGANGVLRIGAVNDGTQTPAGTNTSLVGYTTAWKGNMGKGAYPSSLRFGARVKCLGNGTVWNVGSLFVGFADSGALGAGTMPIYDTGASDTGGIAAVSNAFGFLFSEAGDTGFRGVSARGGATGRQNVSLTQIEPTVNTWHVLEMELTRDLSDTGGTVKFYIDGVMKGRIESPVTTSEPLVPGVWVMSSDTGAPIIDVDWIAVSGTRDTGQ